MATSQKVANAVSKEQSKRKASEVKTTELTNTLSHEKERVAAATSLANTAIMLKQRAEHGVVRSTERSLEEKYRNRIEKLQDELKSSNLFFEKAKMDLQQKDKEIDELKGVIQVR